MRSKNKTYLILDVVLLFITLTGFSIDNLWANEDSKYLEAVREFADNVLKYGRDTYGPKHTPLFVDGVNIHTHEPVKWISPKGDLSKTTETEEWILSNFASQQTLLRTLDGLSILTGDPKYSDAAMQAIKYAFENLRAPNGLLYWGHYVAYDAERDEIKYAAPKFHILKVHYPYYELMWQVDPEATEKFIGAYWSAHVLDWSNLDFDRIADYSIPLEEPWKHEYIGGPVFFQSKRNAGGFFNTGTSLAHAAATLYQLSKEEQPLVWSKRLIKRFIDTRHPKTLLIRYQYNRLNWNVLGDDVREHFIDLHSFVFPNYIFPGERNNYYPEDVQPHQWMSILLIGEMMGEQGREFTQWALEELIAWGKASYRKGDNSFVPIITDGTNIEGYILKERSAIGDKGDVATALPVDLDYFWAYAMAYGATSDEFIWDVVRNIGIGNGLGDIGISPKGHPELEIDTVCSEVYGLLGFLELYKKTKINEFLGMARRIADNIVTSKFHKGFFVQSKRHIYTRFDCFEPLALLHLSAELDFKGKPIPRVWPSSPLFVPPYRYKREGVDRRIIYTLTDSPEVPMSLQEAAAIGDIKTLKSFIEKGVNLDSCEDSLRDTALQRAARAGRTDSVELLLTGGADPNIKDLFENTTLNYAVKAGLKDIAELLLDYGAEVNVKDDKGNTPLFYAVRGGHKEVVELLIASGVDVNAKDNRGNTPLDLAKRRGRIEIVEILTKAAEEQKAEKEKAEKKGADEEQQAEEKNTEQEEPSSDSPDMPVEK